LLERHPELLTAVRQVFLALYVVYSERNRHGLQIRASGGI